MQRVKAHELRKKEDKALVEELTKFRVTAYFLIDILERIGPIKSKQGICSPTS